MSEEDKHLFLACMIAILLLALLRSYRVMLRAIEISGRIMDAQADEIMILNNKLKEKPEDVSRSE